VNGSFIQGDPIIPLLQKVNADSIWNTMAAMTKLERYASASESNVSAQKLADIFKTRYKYSDVVLDTFSTAYSPNIVVTKPGTTKKDSILIVCGHYDVYAKGAPGADDNASGAAVTMEVARVLQGVDLQKTVVFILFSAEELGLKGSADYATKAASAKKKIAGVINIDVCAYRWDKKVRIEAAGDNNSKDFCASYFSIIKKYLPDVAIWDGFSSQYKGQSDNKSFWTSGYKAIIANSQLDPAHINPMMHTSNDVMNTSANCKEQPYAIAKSVVASMATWGEIIEDVGISSLNSDQKMVWQGRYNSQTGRIMFTIPKNYSGDVNYSILNSKGVILHEGTCSGTAEQSIDWEKHAPGLYFVRIASVLGTDVRSVIVDR